MLIRMLGAGTHDSILDAEDLFIRTNSRQNEYTITGK